jgi:hypothetical protein
MAHRVSLLSAALAAVLVASCDPALRPHARQRLLDTGTADPVAVRLAAPHRMAVLYWPRIGECTLAEIRIARALGELGRRFPDIELLTLLPDGADEGGRYGVPYPGEVVKLTPEDYVRQRAVAPLPRVEVWSGGGALLLLRSIPPLAAQADLLVEEIEWSRAFTRPLEPGPAESGEPPREARL